MVYRWIYLRHRSMALATTCARRALRRTVNRRKGLFIESFRHRWHQHRRPPSFKTLLWIASRMVRYRSIIFNKTKARRRMVRFNNSDSIYLQQRQVNIWPCKQHTPLHNNHRQALRYHRRRLFPSLVVHRAWVPVRHHRCRCHVAHPMACVMHHRHRSVVAATVVRSRHRRPSDRSMRPALLARLVH